MLLSLLTTCNKEIRSLREVITISEANPNARTDAIGREASMEF
jgi:hypothetical protein